MAMRILAVLAVVATLGWCGYWLVGARALDHAIATGLTSSSVIDASDHTIQGFPNRFDVTVESPRFETDSLQWSAPFVQFFALSYRLNHLITVFAHDQRISVLGRDATLHSEDLRASLVMEAGLDLPLDRFTLIGQQLELSTEGQTHRLENLRAASRRLSEREHEIGVVLETVFPDTGHLDRIDPERHLPRRLDVLRLNAEVEFDRALDRHAVGGPEPMLVRWTLTGGRAAWGGTDFVASGELSPGLDGLLSGIVELSVTGWRELTDRLRASGGIPPENDALVSLILQGLVNPEDANRIDAEFTVTNGTVYLGPILIGAIPAVF